MSIASELTALANNRDAIKAAIEAKGVADAGYTLAEFPAAIASIPSGGGEVWTKPDAWPNIVPILEADTHQYANKIIALFDVDASTQSISLTGGTYYVLSDGYEGNGGDHAWDASKDITGADGRKYRWGIVMSDGALGELAPCSGGSFNTKVLWSYGPDAEVVFSRSYPNYRMMFCQSVTVKSITQTSGYRAFSNMYSLRILQADSISLVSLQEAFYGDRNLIKINVGSFDTTACTIMNSAFANCYSLVEAPDFDSSNCTNMSSAFANCTSLKSIPHLDTSSCTDASGVFQCCDALESIPSLFAPQDGCKVTRIYQGCHNLHKPLSRIVPTSGDVVIFYDCELLDSMGDYVDMRNVTNWSSMFASNSFDKTPTTLLLNASLDISSAYYRAEHKDRFAEFDGSGNLVGGLVYNINSVSGLTLTVGSNMRSFFNTDEVQAIEAAMTAKGWTIAW